MWLQTVYSCETEKTKKKWRINQGRKSNCVPIYVQCEESYGPTIPELLGARSRCSQTAGDANVTSIIVSVAHYNKNINIL